MKWVRIMIKRSANPAARYLLLGVISLFVGFHASYAKKLQWDNSVYTHYSDQEPLKSFLEALAASQKTPIIMSDKIDAVISGYYRKRNPKEIFLNVLKSNGLVWYYDGDTLFVEREDEMQTGSVSLNHISASEFTQALERLGILDQRYQWTASDVDQMVYFKGPEPLVTAVLEMSKVLDKKIIRPQVYRWVDEKGVTNFSTSEPENFNNNKKVTIIDGEEERVVLGKKPRVQ